MIQRNSQIDEYEREQYKAFHDDILSIQGLMFWLK